MGLLDDAKEDIKDITSDPDEFGKEIIFEAPDGSTATVTGLHTKHHLGYDTDGNRVNTKNAHISVSEQLLDLQDYPVRNGAGNVSLRGHKVTVTDSTGSACTYKIKECFPNETVGLLTCILELYA